MCCNFYIFQVTRSPNTNTQILRRPSQINKQTRWRRSAARKLNEDLEEIKNISSIWRLLIRRAHMQAEINLRCHSCSTKEQVSQNTERRCCIIFFLAFPVQSLTHPVQGHVFPRRLSQPLCASSVMWGGERFFFFSPLSHRYRKFVSFKNKN